MKPSKQKQANQAQEAGQGFVEYALILILVGIAVVAVVALMQPAIGDVFSRFVAQAPVAPPSLLNYTPPPTFTSSPTIDPSASATTEPPVPSGTPPPPTETETSIPPTETDTPPPPTETPSPTPCGPYGPFTVSTSGTVRVQAEDFRCGGAGVAFSDSGGAPGSGSYRSDVGDEGPDLENGSEGVNVGWTQNGEWLEYEIISPVTDSYIFNVRHASENGNNPRIQIHTTSVDDGYDSDTSTISLGTTGGWQIWQSRSVQVTLYEGRNIVRLNIVTGNGNYNYFDIQPYIPTATPPPWFNLYLEAESGSGLNGQWDINNSGSASGGQYITWGGQDSFDDPPGSNRQVTYSFNAPSAGLYQVHLRVDTGNSGTTDSIWVKIDGTDTGQSQNITRSDGWVKFNNMVRVSTWTWDQVHNTDSGNTLVEFYLPAGSHTLRFGYREADTWIDRIYITNSGNPP